MTTAKNFPSDYPSHIPPKEAIELNIELFRLVSKIPPDANDFIATYRLPSAKNRRARLAHKPGFYGVFFFSIYDAILRKQKEIPAFKDQIIAYGHIGPEHGKGIIGNNQHVDMWLYEGVYPTRFMKYE